MVSTFTVRVTTKLSRPASSTTLKLIVDELYDIKSELAEDNLELPQIIGIADDYQKGLYQVLFAHPASAGHGLTLTKGTATIWASPTPNLEWFSQGKKRIHRIGQNEATETIVVIAENTRDANVFDSLMRKDAKMTSLLEDLKCSKL